MHSTTDSITHIESIWLVQWLLLNVQNLEYIIFNCLKVYCFTGFPLSKNTSGNSNHTWKPLNIEYNKRKTIFTLISTWYTQNSSDYLRHVQLNVLRQFALNRVPQRETETYNINIHFYLKNSLLLKLYIQFSCKTSVCSYTASSVFLLLLFQFLTKLKPLG